MNIKKYIVMALLLLGIGLLRATAQETTGSLNGRVTDETNGFVIGANITVTHVPTGTQYVTATNELGRYYLVNLRVGGPYRVKITAMGMQEKVQDNLTIGLGDPLMLDVVMVPSVKNLSEIVVSDHRTRANTTGAGYNVTSAQIRNIPAGSRSFQDYTKLTPQFNGNSFSGTNFRYNNVTIDGAINNDAIGFSPSLGGQTGTSGQIGSSTRTNSISIDAIQDIQVYIAPYDVKIGNFTGGSINAVTRSGSNTITGSIYGFGRNATLVGNDRVGGTGAMPAAFHDIQAGFRVGLPIIKDKLFFFTNEEITDRVEPLTTTAASPFAQGILTEAQASQITAFYKGSTGGQFDPGTAGAYSVYARSKKFFNRLDWNISGKHQLAVRSNIVLSEATNLTRDDQNFRFSSMDYVQHNNQVATVAELKSSFSNQVANSLIVGYTAVKDYRDPLAYAYYPQMQIAGNTLGTTILLGTDREASVFNMRQNSLEITDNVTIFKGNHTFTLGTHNELYNITYGFVNSPNGRVDYASISDFLAGQPSRIRGNFNYTDQDRSYLLAHPSAKFKANLYSVYVQDEIILGPKFKLTPGLRLDMTEIPQKQQLSLKTRNAMPDAFYGTTYTSTRPQAIGNDYLGQVQVSPRIGFNYDIKGDRSIVLRGGSGIFTGRIPFAWLGYAFYNNGNTYGAFDRRYNYVGNPTAVPPVPPTVPNPGTDPRKPSATGIAAMAVNESGSSALDVNGPTEVDLVDNHFKMPQVWRTSAALDVRWKDGYKLTLEGIYTKSLYDVQFKQINQQDSVSYYQYDAGRQQPIFTGKPVDPAFTSMYLLTNTKKGYRFSLTAQLTKTFPFGLEFSGAYTYGQSKDVANGIRNSMESNWQLNQALNPNNAGLGWSNFDLRHRIIGSAAYATPYQEGGHYRTNVNLFFSAASGAPFTYGFVNSPINIQGTGQQVNLVYIPKPAEMISFFQTGNIVLSNNTTVYKTDADQAQEFERYILATPYLREHRGEFTKRNDAHTPWNVNADIRIAETFTFAPKSGKSITLSWDIFNLTNLLNKRWGQVHFSSDLFNSTASVGLRPTGTSRAGYPIYIWEQPSTPYQTDISQSRWQMQLGARYNF